jgi:hypothetical protein
MHQLEKRAGSFTVEVHYDSVGNPRKAWVRSSLEIQLARPIEVDA